MIRLDYYESCISCIIIVLPLSADKHRFARDSFKKVLWKSETKFSLRQNLRIFFQQNLFWIKKNSDKKKLSEKNFLSRTAFYLVLNFVSD